MSSNKEGWVFWDDMWNDSKQDDENKELIEDKCCGDWDEFGKCNCKNKDNG